MIEATSPSDALFFGGPTPLDRAIDNLTAASIEVQHLRRQARAGRSSGREQLETIGRIEAQLQKLALTLADLRT